jgi:hypothetical protein
MKGRLGLFSGGTLEMKLPSVEDVKTPSAEPARTFKGFIEHLAVPMTSKQALVARLPTLVKSAGKKSLPPRPPGLSSKARQQRVRDILGISEEEEKVYMSLKR